MTVDLIPHHRIALHQIRLKEATSRMHQKAHSWKTAFRTVVTLYLRTRKGLVKPGVILTLVNMRPMTKLRQAVSQRLGLTLGKTLLTQQAALKQRTMADRHSRVHVSRMAGSTMSPLMADQEHRPKRNIHR